MAKNKSTRIHRDRISKSMKDGEKVSRVMTEFKNGTLKTPQGKLVTSKEQAIAIALSEAGISSKDMEKSELRNKLVSVRKSLEMKLEKEIANDKSIRAEIVKFFKSNPQPTDDQMHGLADKLKLDPSELETIVYSILSDIISGGLSGGKDTVVDPKELEMGIAVEAEHTSDKGIAEKIARDHLAEDPKYYSKLKVMEKE
jgi:hypothetical protein